MFARLTFLARMLYWPLKPLVQCKIVAAPQSQSALGADKPLFYITKVSSASDLATLMRVCRQLGLPAPDDEVQLGSVRLPRTLYLENPKTLSGHQRPSAALQIGQQLLEAHLDHTQDAQLIPVSINWGRAPGKEASVKAIIGEQAAPNWLRKLLIVLISGRHTLVQFSDALSLRDMAGQYGAATDTAHKLLRMARFHFYRQQLAATGPRQPDRAALFNALLGSASVRQAIEEEALQKQMPLTAARQEALLLLEEIAADQRESTVRLGERFLRWLFGKLYTGIQVRNNEQVRELAQRGHEIVYLPCHRSHMDYLLLSYVIYQQGLASPHIAAGINLNFWPIGKAFRRGGAFFIRRSFSGNKLYSTVFREYLTQLFRKGYAVKYYSEGGRSRTGRLLQPKTGMLAMTIQAMLRGIDRPVTIVPVYLGYEHVMEVGTYLRELKGTHKAKESAFGIVKAATKLRNYGFGFVNFGEPLSLNQFLQQQVPDWKTAIDPLEPPRPDWLNPVVSVLAHQVMLRINQSAAVNSVNLLATCILAAPQQVLPKPQLLAQMELYLRLLRDAPYHANVTLAAGSATELLQHAERLQKVQIEQDDFGALVRFAPHDQVLMSYYRSNISHLFIIPAILATALLQQPQTKHALLQLTQQLQPLLEQELFLAPQHLGNYVESLIQFMQQEGLIDCNSQTDSLSVAEPQRAKLELLACLADAVLQRYSMVLQLIRGAEPMERDALEQKAHQLALRLSTLHGLDSPEFHDKRLFVTLINALKDLGYIHADAQYKLQISESFDGLDRQISQLLSATVNASIHQIGSQSA